MVNLINSVFLELDEITLRENQFKLLKTETTFFDEGLFIVRLPETASVVSRCVPEALTINNGKEQSLWRFQLIYPRAVIANFNDLAVPIFLTLQDIAITDNVFTATTIDINATIEIFSTDFQNV